MRTTRLPSVCVVLITAGGGGMVPGGGLQSQWDTVARGMVLGALPLCGLTGICENISLRQLRLLAVKTTSHLSIWLAVMSHNDVMLLA